MEILNNISLLPFNTFGIDLQAKHFATVSSQDELSALIEWNKKAQQPLLVLGGGSNVLLTRDFDGLVVKNEIRGIDTFNEDEAHIYLKAGGGEQWHSFVLYCLQGNYAGIENLALIPGCVGASPMQNIGAYGVEIESVFHSLTAIDRQDGSKHIFYKNDCAFGYRESVFKHEHKGRFVIADVTYCLNKQPSFHIEYGAIRQELEKENITELSIQAIAKAVINIRQSKLPDPKVIGNAGSFFKNPFISKAQYEMLKKEFPALVAYENEDGSMKLAAGWLIEQAGLKGYRKGDAGVHQHQALVLVNYAKATGREVLDVCDLVMDTVYQKFGVKLSPEVNIL